MYSTAFPNISDLGTMKPAIAILISLILLTGCAARDENNQVIHNPDGSEKISFWRTTGLVVGLPLIVAGVILGARSGGGNSSSYTPPASYPGNCQHDNDIAADGSRCGLRSADSRPGGY